MDLKYTILGPDAIVPTQHADDKIDLYCPRLTVVGPERSVTIDTCIGLHFPAYTIGMVVDIASEHKRFATKFGLFNNDCRGSIKVVVCNTTSDQTLEIQRGDVIAEMIIIPEAMMARIRRSRV